MKIITNNSFLELAKKDFPKLVSLFNKITIPTCKSDIARLLIIYYYGGIYIDCNTTPKESFNNFYEKHKNFDFIISFNYTNNDFSTRILFSQQKSLVLKAVLNKITQNLTDLYNKEQQTSNHVPYNILVLTGTYPFYDILGRNNCKKTFPNIAYFDDASPIIQHYGCNKNHHHGTNVHNHWSRLQKRQKLFNK